MVAVYAKITSITGVTQSSGPAGGATAGLARASAVSAGVICAPVAVTVASGIAVSTRGAVGGKSPTGITIRAIAVPI